MSTLQVISLGNDIVDLNDPDTVNLLNNKKFLQRVFCESELENLTQLAIDKQNSYLWKLWAAKEAAYKSIKRLRNDIIFSPRRFHVSSDTASVNYEDVCFFVDFKENNKYLHASCFIFCETVNSSEIKFIDQYVKFVSPQDISLDVKLKATMNVQNWIISYKEIRKIIQEKNISITSSYSHESSLCRTYAALQISQYPGFNKVRIRKSSHFRNAIPEIWLNDIKTNHLLSISHHGEYCAVLFCQLHDLL
ncbi:MAG: 4'-phosphopantetheinyl transferase superfamily protein [Spirochaetia bacterium]|nr:4'-phosphopantetheinyl transferase superfamily protein [Spirochaetia bacterium]